MKKPGVPFSKYFKKRRTIEEIVREPTAGGIIYRKNKGQTEILLVQDSRERWTIPKGHIEKGETPRQTAKREIYEETGLRDIKIESWLGKINFKYRRQQSLVLMTTHIYLAQALKNTNKLKKEHWMKGIKWFTATEALNEIEYEDIGKLILLGLRRIRTSM